jgi:hypothetical protein
VNSGINSEKVSQYDAIRNIKRTWRLLLSSTPLNGQFFGVQMFPAELDSTPVVSAEVGERAYGNLPVDPTKFTVNVYPYGFRAFTVEQQYAGYVINVTLS